MLRRIAKVSFDGRDTVHTEASPAYMAPYRMLLTSLLRILSLLSETKYSPSRNSRRGTRAISLMDAIRQSTVHRAVCSQGQAVISSKGGKQDDRRSQKHLKQICGEVCEV